jgi:thioredoxin 1
MSKPVHITDAEFEEKVLGSQIPVIVDFWAPWCGPCKMIAPVLEQIAGQYGDKLLVAKVNTDEHYEWAMKYGVQGIPTLLFVSGGKVVDRQIGAVPAPVLKAKAEKLLKAASPITP